MGDLLQDEGFGGAGAAGDDTGDGPWDDDQELLPKRRMVRHYAPTPVSRDALERIVSTVRRAPSAG